MNEWVDIRRGTTLFQRAAVADVQAGDRYRVCTPNFTGPWRVAAENATQTRGKWGVKDVRPRKHRRGVLLY